MNPRLWAAFAAAIVLGYASKAAGIVAAGVAATVPEAERLDALDRYYGVGFTTYTYSDIAAVSLRNVGWPYLESPFEYPVLAGAIHTLGQALGGGLAGFSAQYAVLAFSAAATVWALGRTPGANAWIFVASPALVLYAGLNWDLAAVAGCALAVSAFLAGRPRTGGLWSALGGAVKLFPAVFAPAFAVALARQRRWRSALATLAVFAGVLLATNLPVAFASFDGWSYFFQFSADRRAKDTLWNVLPAVAEHANTLGPIVVVLGWSWALAQLWRGRGSVVSAGWFLMLWFLLWSKVASPQFSLFTVCALAAMGAPWRLAALIGVVDVLYFLAGFTTLAAWRNGTGMETTFTLWLVQPTVALRLGALALATAWCAARLLSVDQRADHPPATRDAALVRHPLTR